MAASCLLTASAFGLPLAGVCCDIIDLLLQIISLVRGTSAIFHTAGHQIPHSTPRMVRRHRHDEEYDTSDTSDISDDSDEGEDADDGGPMVSPDGFRARGGFSHRLCRFEREALSHTAPWPEAEAAIDQLLAAIAQIPDETEDIKTFPPQPSAPERRHILTEAACQLRTALGHAAAAPPKTEGAVCLMWFSMVSPTFLARVQARDPFALILLAYWSVSLRNAPPHMWWLDGWTERAVSAVARELVSYPACAPLLAWAWSEARAAPQRRHT